MTWTWAPSALPRIRDRMITVHRRGIQRMQRPLPTALVPDPEAVATSLDRTAARLGVAELYWVTPAMTAVALDASGDLPDWPAGDSRPAPSGLLVWSGGLPVLAWAGAPEPAWTINPLGVRTPPLVTVDAILWGARHDVVEVSILTRSGPIREHLHGAWGDADLFPFADLTLDIEQSPVVSGEWSDGLVATIGATWIMMQQPTVATPRLVDVDLDTRGSYRLAGRPQPVVTLVDLRRAVAPDRGDHEPTHREYHHRWMVRGHWRQQPHGPARSLRRPTWVVPHVKGPAGAPLIETEQVMVWRR